MSRLVRFVIACLLALALPLQGAAGVLGMHCQGPVVPEAPCAGHDEGLHPMPQQADGAADASPLDSGGAMLDEGEGSGCSACAACCAATALPTHRLTWAVPQPQPPHLAALHAQALTFLTAGPERPPRPLPA